MKEATRMKKLLPRFETSRLAEYKKEKSEPDVSMRVGLALNDWRFLFYIYYDIYIISIILYIIILITLEFLLLIKNIASFFTSS